MRYDYIYLDQKIANVRCWICGVTDTVDVHNQSTALQDAIKDFEYNGWTIYEDVGECRSCHRAELSPGNRASMDAMSNGTFPSYLLDSQRRKRRMRPHRCTIRSRRRRMTMNMVHYRTVLGFDLSWIVVKTF